MKEIKLSQIGKHRGKYVTLVDDEDFEYLNKWKWNVCFYKENKCRVARRERGKTIYMHRVIMNTPKGMEVDHRDFNGLNNQRRNLRECTKSQNAMNRRPGSGRTFKGFYLQSGKYIAGLRINSKHIHIGCYDTEKEAAMAYNEAAKKYYGEFACLNVIE